MLAISAAFALLGLVAAQSSNGSTATAQQVQIAQANFQAAQISGQNNMLPTFDPQGTLALTFGNNAITIGQRVDQSNAGSAPTIGVAAAASGSRINTQSMYTVMMVDADIVGTNANTTPLTRHWLVNTVMLQNGTGPYSINYTGSVAVTDYAGPGPAAGSGPHRYVVLLYAQSSSFTPPANLSTAGVGLATWNLQSYVTSSGLGPLVAANYFQVENGQATVTPPATSAVNTATITASSTSSPGASGASGSATSRSSSGAASGASSAPAASSSRAAASETKSLGMGVIVGAVGVMGCVLAAGLGL